MGKRQYLHVHDTHHTHINTNIKTHTHTQRERLRWGRRGRVRGRERTVCKRKTESRGADGVMGRRARQVNVTPMQETCCAHGSTN